MFKSALISEAVLFETTNTHDCELGDVLQGTENFLNTQTKSQRLVDS